MFYANVETIKVLAAEKQHKPLIIENVVVALPRRPSVWRKRCAAILRELAEMLEPSRTLAPKTAGGVLTETPTFFQLIRKDK